MNTAQIEGLQPVSGPFRWPGEVDLRKCLTHAVVANQDAVLDLLRLGGEMQAKSLSDCLNISYTDVNVALRGLAGRRLIKRANKSVPYLWVAI